MAKFCKYCGKELEEGEVCTCGGAAAQTEAVSGGKDVKGYAAGMWGFFKEFVKKPVSAGMEFVHACDMRSALIIIGVQAVLVAFLVMSLTGKFNGAIKNLIALTGSVEDLVGASGLGEGIGATVLSGIFFSLPTVFITTLITAFAVACLLALVLFGFIKLFKGNTSYTYMLSVSAVNSLVLIPFTLLGLIVSLIMPLNLGLSTISNLSSIITPFIFPVGIACLGIALGKYVMMQIVPGGSDLNKERLPYVVFLTGVVMAVAFLFIFKIAASMCLPSLIKMGADSLGAAGDILESLF